MDPEKNAYKFYKLSSMGDMVRASYGRMGQMKGQLFGERSYDYPLSMFWIKYYEKLSKGYVDRSDVYMDESDKSSQKQAETGRSRADKLNEYRFDITVYKAEKPGKKGG